MSQERKEEIVVISNPSRPWPFVEGARHSVIDGNTGWRFITIRGNPVGIAERLIKWPD